MENDVESIQRRFHSHFGTLVCPKYENARSHQQMWMEQLENQDFQDIKLNTSCTQLQLSL